MKKGLIFMSGVLGVSLLALILLIIVYIAKPPKEVNQVPQTSKPSVVLVTLPHGVNLPEWAQTFESTITEDLLTVNPYSRPAKDLDKVNGIVVHYVGNPGTTAAQNRSYFQNLAETHETYASSHFVIGLNGEIIQCVPLDEIAYASNERNSDTISVECCHPDSSGKFNDATESALVKLTAYLCIYYNLDPMTDVIRHYDVTGKACPKYYVDNENQWSLFKSKVQAQMTDK